LYKNPKAHGVKPSVVRHPIADHVEWTVYLSQSQRRNVLRRQCTPKRR